MVPAPLAKTTVPCGAKSSAFWVLASRLPLTCRVAAGVSNKTPEPSTDSAPCTSTVALSDTDVETVVRKVVLRKKPDKVAEIDSALVRLTAGGPKGMGEMFKVLAIADPKFGPLPGFERDAGTET